MSEMAILELPMGPNDADAVTIRLYLRELLLQLWEKEDGFSGKRPFGSSSWKYEVYAALIKGGAIAGTLDENGFVERFDRNEREKADKIILDCILNMCAL